MQKSRTEKKSVKQKDLKTENQHVESTWCSNLMSNNNSPENTPLPSSSDESEVGAQQIDTSFGPFINYQNNNEENQVFFGPIERPLDFQSDTETDIIVVGQEKRISKMSDYMRLPEPFDVTGNLAENWRSFKRDFDIYTQATELDKKEDAVRKGVFLNLLGKKAVRLYDSLKFQDDANFDAVVKGFNDFCESKKNIVYERYMFRQRMQKEGETFDSFLVDLKELVKNCKFEEMASIEEEMLRDQIVLGISNKQLQRKLLETTDLSYLVAIDKCRVTEATFERSQSMNKAALISEVRSNNKNRANTSASHGRGLRVEHSRNAQKNRSKNGWRENRQQQTQQREKSHANDKNGKTELRICKFCNFKHTFGQANCPAYGKECRTCSKKNHFSSVCKIKNVNSINVNDFENNSDFYCNSIMKINELNFSNAFDVDLITQVVDCNASTIINTRKFPVWREDINVNGKLVSFKVDTGSDVTILPKRLLDQIAPNIDLKSSPTVLKGFAGNIVRPLGV